MALLGVFFLMKDVSEHLVKKFVSEEDAYKELLELALKNP